MLARHAIESRERDRSGRIDGREMEFRRASGHDTPRGEVSRGGKVAVVDPATAHPVLPVIVPLVAPLVAHVCDSGNNFMPLSFSTAPLCDCRKKSGDRRNRGARGMMWGF